MALRKIDFKFQRRWAPQAYNPHHNVVIQVRGRRVELEHGGGSKDSVSVFKEGDTVYVLGVNRGLNYIGLDAYDVALRSELVEHRQSGGEEPYLALDHVGDVFVQSDYEITEILGSRELDQADSTLVRKLIEYLPY